MDKELEKLLVGYFQRGVLSLYQIVAVLKRYKIAGFFQQIPTNAAVEHKQFYFKFEQDIDDDCARAIIHELTRITEVIYGK